MKVLSVTSEIFPLVKTGGLADVAGSLPKALQPYGIETISLIPGYPRVMDRLDNLTSVIDVELLGETGRILRTECEGLNIFVLDIPGLYARIGGPYLDEQGTDFPDNNRRFAALSLAGALVADGLIANWQPNLVHTHDWQSALTSVYLKHSLNRNIPTVLTIHNLAFQGQFSRYDLSALGLPIETYSTGCLEYYGDISFLKGGIQTADMVTTVSPTYAREIRGEGLGMGMEGVLKANRKKLKGIVNGIDTEVWNPAVDPCLVQNFDRNSLAARSRNRRHLINLFDFRGEQAPIFAVISRLTWQKGIDLLIETVPHLVEAGGRLIICGEGDRDLQERARNLAKHYPQRVAVSIGYNEGLAHLIYGGSDFIIQPSRFEPCGLTQLYGMRYGSVPIVARTGGLSETIIDANDAARAAKAATGIQFHPITAEVLSHAIDRAFELFAKPSIFNHLQLQGMKADFSWDASARQYAAMFEELVGASSHGLPSIAQKRAL